MSDIVLCEPGPTPIQLFQILVVSEQHLIIYVVSVACNVLYWLLKSVPWQMAPENIRWGSAYQTLPNQVGWLSSDGAMRGTGRRSERFHDHGYHSPNGITLFNSNHIDVPNTGNLVKKVCWSRFLVWVEIFLAQSNGKSLFQFLTCS